MIYSKGNFQSQRFLLLFILLMVQACVRLPVDPGKLDEAVKKHTSTTRSCPQISKTACAQESPYKILARKVFSQSTGSSKHFVNLLNYGDEAFIARVHLIRSAQETIYIQTFIWGRDETSYFIARELIKAAQRGVRIKVLVDQLGLMGEGPELKYEDIAHSNIEIKIYNPILNEAHLNYLELLEAALFKFEDFNQRMHNKTMIVDNKIAITGGRNIEDKYFDMDPRYNFKDLDVLVVGPVVNDITRSFWEYWSHNLAVFAKDLSDVSRKLVGLTNTGPNNKLLNFPTSPRLIEWDQKASNFEYIKDTFTSKAMAIIGHVEFISDPPGKLDNGTALSESTVFARERLFKRVRNSLLIQTPYLVFSRYALDQFYQLRKDYPNADIAISSNSLAATDNIPVYANSIKQKKYLIEKLGIRIFEFKPVPEDVRSMIPRYDRLIYEKEKAQKSILDKMDGFWANQYPGPRIGLHGKSFVINGRISWIGSHNFDPRSDSFNTEVALVIWDERVAQALTKTIHLDIQPQNSWVVAKRLKVAIFSILSGFLESFWRALPLFDFWPFYCCSSFELRSGHSVLPSNHPEFYKNYYAVGPYPQMNFSPKEIEARMIKAMGGWITPIL